MADDGAYTLDELAAEIGVASRTIRYWQSLGVIPPPQRRGRVSVYDEGHRRRLTMVAELSRRGIRLDTVCELLDLINRGSDSIREWLGVPGEPGDDAGLLREDRRMRLARDELEALLGTQYDVIQGLLRTGLAYRLADGTWQVPSTGLFELALRVDRLGIDTETTIGADAILRRHLRPLAEMLVAWFDSRLPPPDSPRAGLARFGALRPIGGDAARLILLQELTRAFRARIQGRSHDREEKVVERWLQVITSDRNPAPEPR